MGRMLDVSRDDTLRAGGRGGAGAVSHPPLRPPQPSPPPSGLAPAGYARKADADRFEKLRKLAVRHERGHRARPRSATLFVFVLVFVFVFVFVLVFVFVFVFVLCANGVF